MSQTDEERERRNRRLLGPSTEAQRDMDVARATVRPRSECPHCNPPSPNQRTIIKEK